MGFLQIISFHTDRIEELKALDDQWAEATAGERTITGGQLYADRDDPTHFVALDWFTDYDSAMVNSALPATAALAEQAMKLSTAEPVFHNLEPAYPVGMQGEAELRAGLESGSLDRRTFTDDVALDMVVPQFRVRTTGVDAMEAGLASEAPGRTFDLWDAQPTPTGFVVEYAYRTTGVETSTLSVGSVVATVTAGRISRLFVTCGGNWTAEQEAEIVAASGPIGPGSRG